MFLFLFFFVFTHEQNEDGGGGATGVTVVDPLIRLISSTTHHTCVVTRSNNLRCWGYDRDTIFPTGFGKKLNIGSGNGPTIRQGNFF